MTYFILLMIKPQPRDPSPQRHFPLQDAASAGSAQVTYPAWAGRGQFVQRLCQVDPGIVHHLPHGIVFLLPRKGQLGECSLVARGVLDVNEVLLIRDRVVLRQLKEPNQGLQQGNPGSKQGRGKLECLKYVRTGGVVKGCSNYLELLII